MIESENSDKEMKMEHFFVGTLIENRDGATYEGVVYDRFLKIRLQTGEVVAIFDGLNPISTELLISVPYEVILTSLVIPDTVRTLRKLLPCEKQDILYGVVMKHGWIGKPESYKYVHEDKLRKKDCILVATTWGNLLIDTKELENSVTVGQTIRWESLRLDLLAVI